MRRDDILSLNNMSVDMMNMHMRHHHHHDDFSLDQSQDEVESMMDQQPPGQPPNQAPVAQGNQRFFHQSQFEALDEIAGLL